MTQAMMKAVQLDAPGPPEALQIRELPVPVPPAGWVRIRIEAFGLNRSELHLRHGFATNATFPRVPGIECAGTIDESTTTSFVRGEKVVAMMGGMGREYDGGYGEFAIMPASQVIAVDTDLPWEIVGAIPEMLQTAYGSLKTGLELQSGQTLLIRGGTSSVGMAAATVARQIGAMVIATTRQQPRLAALAAHGVDHPLLDDGAIATAVRDIVPNGVDAVLELVGTNTLRDSLRATRVGGTVCFTGMVSNEWTIRDFYPIEFIPTGVRLTAYGGEASDLPREVLQQFLDDVAAGRISVRIHRVFAMEEIVEAHRIMENNAAVGKMVVRVRQ
jgi:NADPH:quinone reductase